jgi:hypothetical protein
MEGRKEKENERGRETERERERERERECPSTGRLFFSFYSIRGWCHPHSRTFALS